MNNEMNFYALIGRQSISEVADCWRDKTFRFPTVSKIKILRVSCDFTAMLWLNLNC